MPVIFKNVILAFEVRKKDFGCQICKVLSLTVFGVASCKNPWKIKSVRFISGARMCHEHEVRAATNNFVLRKEEQPRKPKMLIAIILTLTEHYL